MTLTDWIGETLRTQLSPTHLTVEDESQQHAGHAGWREGGETHFRIDVVSEAFRGKSRVERHRLINTVLASGFAKGIHALAIAARAPGE